MSFWRKVEKLSIKIAMLPIKGVKKGLKALEPRTGKSSVVRGVNQATAAAAETAKSVNESVLQPAEKILEKVNGLLNHPPAEVAELAQNANTFLVTANQATSQFEQAFKLLSLGLQGASLLICLYTLYKGCKYLKNKASSLFFTDPNPIAHSATAVAQGNNSARSRGAMEETFKLINLGIKGGAWLILLYTLLGPNTNERIEPFRRLLKFK